MEFDYPEPGLEAEIVSREGNIPIETAAHLVKLGQHIRNIREYGLAEGASTRLLIYAARLIRNNIPAFEACQTSIALPLTDDKKLQETLTDLIEDIFGASS